MLILRRRVGESIAIGGEIEIEVIGISRTRVKLGVRAPRSLRVTRVEALPVAAENSSASEFLGSRGFEEIKEMLPLLGGLSGKPH